MRKRGLSGKSGIVLLAVLAVLLGLWVPLGTVFAEEAGCEEEPCCPSEGPLCVSSCCVHVPIAVPLQQAVACDPVWTMVDFVSSRLDTSNPLEFVFRPPRG